MVRTQFYSRNGYSSACFTLSGKRNYHCIRWNHFGAATFITFLRNLRSCFINNLVVYFTRTHPRNGSILPVSRYRCFWCRTSKALRNLINFFILHPIRAKLLDQCFKFAHTHTHPSISPMIFAISSRSTCSRATICSISALSLTMSMTFRVSSGCT